MAGGGGLILLPSLFAAFPEAPAATLVGTNKLGAVAGTATAAINYVRRVQISVRGLLPMMIAAFLSSFGGAYLLTLIPTKPLRAGLPFVLLALLLYVLKKPQLGSTHKPSLPKKLELWWGLLGGVALGLYDGLFGPGTGAFLMLFFVRIFGYDFLHASAATKLVNLSTNIAALLLLGSRGHILWQTGIVLAVANVAGGQIGSRLALRHGTKLVRRVFVVVVSALIVKMAYDAFV